MIYGIGTDIVLIERMSALYTRFGEHALARLLAPQEFSACLASKDPARFLAKRFAAKEALGKALGTGIRAPVLLPAIAVVNDALGKPSFSFSAELSAYIEARQLTPHLSISDEQNAALAFVVVEQQ